VAAYQAVYVREREREPSQAVYVRERERQPWQAVCVCERDSPRKWLPHNQWLCVRERERRDQCVCVCKRETALAKGYLTSSV